MKYKTIEELIDYIEGPIKTSIYQIYSQYKEEMLTKQGSQHNHQAWPGGYADHIVEVMNIARVLYHALKDHRALGFTVSDALVVLFLHDIEKLFPERIHQYTEALGISRGQAKTQVRCELISGEPPFLVWEALTPIQYAALHQVDGEGDKYTNQSRIMTPLAAFCHMCDVASARIWYDRPSEDQETWGFRNGVPEETNLWGV